jgi:hypothetical protein
MKLHFTKIYLLKLEFLSVKVTVYTETPTSMRLDLCSESSLLLDLGLEVSVVPWQCGTLDYTEMCPDSVLQ